MVFRHSGVEKATVDGTENPSCEKKTVRSLHKHFLIIIFTDQTTIMYKFFSYLSLLLLLPALLRGNDYDKAWEALHQNNRKQAFEYLEKAMNDPASSVN